MSKPYQHNEISHLIDEQDPEHNAVATVALYIAELMAIADKHEIFRLQEQFVVMADEFYKWLQATYPQLTVNEPSEMSSTDIDKRVEGSPPGEIEFPTIGDIKSWLDEMDQSKPEDEGG